MNPIKLSPAHRKGPGEDTVAARSSSRPSSGRWLAGFAALLLGFAPGSAFGQSDNAQITGFVRDPSGAVISGAKIVVKSQAKSVERTAVTNESGYYVISNLPPDVYSVTVEQPGFKRS